MALKAVRPEFIRRYVRLFQSKNFMKISSGNCSTMPQAEIAQDESLYPPIKTKYPPGKWKKIDSESAWKIHDSSHTVLQFPKAKKRLDFLAGDESRTLWLIEALTSRPNNTEFQKIVTKTEVLSNEPNIDISNNELLEKLSQLSTSLKADYSDLLIHGTNKIVPRDCEDVERWNMHKFVGDLLRSSVSLLSSSNEHLRRSEIDQNVRVESFWRVIGFEGDEKSCKGTWDLPKTVEKIDAGVIQVQYRHMADYQIRTENPLPEFLSIDDPSCSVKDTKLPQYAPDAVAVKSIEDRPINVAGHWIGSPCEFTSGSIHIMPSKFVEEYENYGMKYLEEAEVLMAMTSMFGSCVAQAQNQGFCDVLDITYPLATQSIIFNKHNVRFGYYQLNTLQLWNDANTLQNVMWISQPIKLFEEKENGEKLINKEFLSRFLKFLLLEPKNRGINMRPYLPEDKAPSTTEAMINLRGEEVIPQPVHGRFEHPRYSIYY